MKVVILQGIPGIGKSTYTKQFKNALVCSADDFLYEFGRYVWHASKLGHAHEQCFNKFKNAIENKTGLIFVDNTNTRAKELKNYVEFAREHNYEIELLWLKGDPEVFGMRNTHNVSMEIINKIHGRLMNFNASSLGIPRKIIELSPP
jgi:predicted kinase